MRSLGRSDQQDLPSGSYQARKGWRKKPPFTERWLWLKDFGDCIARPTSTRQFCVQHGKTAGHYGLSGLANLSSPPNCLRKAVWELPNIKRLRRTGTGRRLGVHYSLKCGGHGVISDVCIKTQYSYIFWIGPRG
jgi:hypothetical protein